MHILLVESVVALSHLWAGHLQRAGHRVTVAHGQSAAADVLYATAPDLILLNLELDEGAALAVADMAAVFHPKAKVIFVTKSRFFSDGSIFAHSGNACAMIPSHMPPADMAALAEYHAA